MTPITPVPRVPSAPAHGADLSNWRRPPFSRWSFRHVDALLRTDRIAAAEVSPAAPVTAMASTALVDSFALRTGDGQADLDLPTFLERTHTDALVVERDGRIVHEYYADGMDAHTPHILMSATKSVVGLIAATLAARGALDLAATVADCLPELAQTSYRAATLRDLLDMRTGIGFDVAGHAAYAAASGWEPRSAAHPVASLHAFFASLTAPPKPHGGAFSYVSANTDLLGWVLERATGRTFAALASDMLWQPMGAVDDAAITVDDDGTARCTGGMCATARDLAAVGRLIVDGGRRGDRDIVPSSVLADIAHGGDRDAWRTGEFAPAFGGAAMHYRSGWYVIDEAPRTLFAMGIHGQNLFVDVTNRLVVAKLSAQPLPIDPAAIRLTLGAWADIRRCLVAS